jgi:formimidoylglutamate deiminase
VADALWLAAVAGGAQASGRPVAGLRAGQQADFVVLAADEALTPSQRLAGQVFARPPEARVDEVWVAGRRRVAQGRHPLDEAAQRRFAAVRAQLLRDA